jgi:hypothetical protein
MMNEASPSGSAAPETPAPKPPSRKTLYIILGGVCVFLCACLCLAAAVAGVYGISRFANGAGFAGGLNSHRVSNASWQMEVTSIQSSATEIMDSSGGSASPKAGYIFIIVTAKIKNISGKTQSFYLSAGGSNAGLKDKDGTLLDLAAVKRGDSGMTINFANQMQILFIYSAQETYEFYFVALESDRGPFTFTYMDLPPVGPLSLR